eukprot:jgi/Chlat1/5998/Chrsp4S06306
MAAAAGVVSLGVPCRPRLTSRRTVAHLSPPSLPSWGAAKQQAQVSLGRCRARSLQTSRRCQTQAAYASEQPIIDVLPEVVAKKVLVLGGNGFVGSAICKECIAEGLPVSSLNRSGKPSLPSGEFWSDDVIWVRGDVFAADWPVLLRGVKTVVSCLGGFGSNEQMERICGDATITAIDAAAAAGINKFVFISVHNYNLPSFAKDIGYFNGKKRAEEALFSKFPMTGTVLRPGFIYGTRRMGAVGLPLQLVGAPLEQVLKLTAPVTKVFSGIPGSDILLAPPVSVEQVARAAVKAAKDDSITGVLDIDKIKQIARS